MTDNMLNASFPALSTDLIVIVGGYGSGKSEVSVNLAYHLAKSSDKKISIADLDIVNPYFRSREAATRLEKLGVKSIIPVGSQYYADLPIVLPQIKGAVEQNDGIVILDVGGDDVGAKILSSLSSAFDGKDYDLLFVLNANRPFTADVSGSIKVMNEIEISSRLKFTGLISNTHMMDQTTPIIVKEGYTLAVNVSKETELPVVFLSAEANIVEKLDLNEIDTEVLPLNRYLLKPWESPSNSK